MIKGFLAGAATVALMSGVAFAQVYPPAPPPPLARGNSRASAAHPRRQHDNHHDCRA
jgi:hypothetical protein